MISVGKRSSQFSKGAPAGIFVVQPDINIANTPMIIKYLVFFIFVFHPFVALIIVTPIIRPVNIIASIIFQFIFTKSPFSFQTRMLRLQNDCDRISCSISDNSPGLACESLYHPSRMFSVFLGVVGSV
jgi:hypothetical protein